MLRLTTHRNEGGVATVVKEIMRDPMFLAQKSEDANEADRQVVTDLLDTLRANLDHCWVIVI